MGHSLTALLGTQPVLSDFAAREGVPQPVQAKTGVWILPLTEEVIDTVVEIPVGASLAGFTYLFPKLLAKLKMASVRDWSRSAILSFVCSRRGLNSDDITWRSAQAIRAEFPVQSVHIP